MRVEEVEFKTARRVVEDDDDYGDDDDDDDDTARVFRRDGPVVVGRGGKAGGGGQRTGPVAWRHAGGSHARTHAIIRIIPSAIDSGEMQEIIISASPA